MLGIRATDLDPISHQVTLGNGERLDYDRLLLAREPPPADCASPAPTSKESTTWVQSRIPTRADDARGARVAVIGDPLDHQLGSPPLARPAHRAT